MQIPKKYQACASGLKKKSCRIVKMEKYRAAVIRARERIFALRVTAVIVTVIQLKKGNRESENRNKIIFNFIIRHAFFKETV